MLERTFELEKHATNVRIELLAGLTTFMTMAYIIFVNPAILADAGMDKGAVFVATCLAAAFGSAFMGLYANYPVALAPGMGLNAYFTYGVVKGMGHAWETALGAVFLSGILFLIVSLTPIREWVINSIPKSLKLSIAAGIGLFLAIIGLQSAGIVKAHPATLVTLGDLKSPAVVLAVIGFILMAALDARRVPGAILIGILAAAIAGAFLGLTKFTGIVSLPPSIAPVFLKLDLVKALEIGLVTIVFTFFFVDVFDNTGTLVGVAHKAGLVNPDGTLPRRQAGADRRLHGRHGRRRPRHLDHHQLHRKRGGRECRRAHRAGGGDGGRAVSGRAVLRPAGGRHPGVRHRARPRLRGLPDDERGDRDRFRRSVRVRAGCGRDRDHAFDVLDRPRHCLRLHRLCRHQAIRRSARATFRSRSPCWRCCLW
jgi:hypothetical protein